MNRPAVALRTVAIQALLPPIRGVAGHEIHRAMHFPAIWEPIGTLLPDVFDARVGGQLCTVAGIDDLLDLLHELGRDAMDSEINGLWCQWGCGTARNGRI